MKTAAELIPQALQNLPPITPKDSEVVRQCAWCLEDVRLKSDSPFVRALDVTCRECEERQQRRQAEEKQMRLDLAKQTAISRIPKAFQLTVRELLPRPDMLDAVLRWQFGSKGLVLFGPTGLGKSRCAWSVVKREIESGRDVEMVDALVLSRYPAMLMADNDEAAKLSERLATCELLLLDDPFKVKPTERVEELLFLAVDQRMQWERPIIATLNDTGDTLLARLSSDRGPALIRRLREACAVLNFKA